MSDPYYLASSVDQVAKGDFNQKNSFKDSLRQDFCQKNPFEKFSGVDFCQIFFLY